MSPADKLKLTNMIDQSVNHTLARLNVLDPEVMMDHFEKVCANIVYHSDPEDSNAIVDALNEFLVKRASKLNVNRSYTNEQEK